MLHHHKESHMQITGLVFVTMNYDLLCFIIDHNVCFPTYWPSILANHASYKLVWKFPGKLATIFYNLASGVMQTNSEFCFVNVTAESMAQAPS